MYIRFISRGGGKCGPYLYKSVRRGSSVTGQYIGPYTGDLRSVGISIGRTLETFKPPKRYDSAQKIYESTRKRKYPLTVIEDEHGLLEEPYNASVDTRLGIAIVAKNMAVPERVKAELEEAMHMEGHGERTAEKAAIKLMRKRWKKLPMKELQKLRGRDEAGRPLRTMKSDLKRSKKVKKSTLPQKRITWPIEEEDLEEMKEQDALKRAEDERKAIESDVYQQKYTIERAYNRRKYDASNNPLTPPPQKTKYDRNPLLTQDRGWMPVKDDLTRLKLLAKTNPERAINKANLLREKLAHVTSPAGRKEANTWLGRIDGALKAKPKHSVRVRSTKEKIAAHKLAINNLNRYMVNAELSGDLEKVTMAQDRIARRNERIERLGGVPPQPLPLSEVTSVVRRFGTSPQNTIKHSGKRFGIEAHLNPDNLQGWRMATKEEIAQSELNRRLAEINQQNWEAQQLGYKNHAERLRINAKTN